MSEDEFVLVDNAGTRHRTICASYLDHEIDFASDPNAISKPMPHYTEDLAANKGWSKRKGIWYCPTCAADKGEEK